MGDVDLVDTDLFGQFEDAVEALFRFVGDREADTGVSAMFLDQGDRVETFAIGSGKPTETVVHLLDPVDADTDVVECLDDAVDILFVDIETVGRKVGDDALFTHRLGDLEDVTSYQRLASTEDDELDTGFFELGDRSQNEFGSEKILLIRIGVAVAVAAGEIAAVREIPDGDAAVERALLFAAGHRFDEIGESEHQCAFLR